MTTTGHHDREHPVLAAVLLAKDHLTALAEDSLWSLNAGTAVDLLHATSALTAQVAELEARAITHAETLNLPDEAGMRSTATWLARTTHVTGGAACRKVRLAHTTTSHEPTRMALAAGQIHVEQAEAITTAVDQLDDDQSVVSPVDRARAETHLLSEAADHDAHDLTRLGERLFTVLDPDGADAHEARLLERQEARARAKTSLSMRDDGQGLTLGTFALPTAQASAFKKHLCALSAPKHVRATQGAGAYDWTIPTPARMGAAFVEYIERFPAADLPKLGGLAATVVAIGDHDILLGKVKAARLDTGVRISHTEFVRMACEAGVIPAWMDTTVKGGGRVLSLGRKHRFHTTHQRLALIVERQHCEHPGCRTPGWLCHVHHNTPWANGGVTDLKTAVVLCPFHHHQTHATGTTYPIRT